jgi:hypothetical protein
MLTNKLKTTSKLFEFIVSGKITAGLDVSTLYVVEKEVKKEIERAKFKTTYESMVLFPLIADPEIFDAPEYVSYKRRESSIFVSRRIPFEKWTKARTPGRVKMAEQNFIDSILAIDEKRIPKSDQESLVQFIRTAAKRCLQKT